VDLHRFRRLISEASSPGRVDTERVALLRAALDLWRGAALTDISSDWLARMRDSWIKERLDAVALWADGAVRLGRPNEVIGVVRELVAEFPLVEQLTAALMRALAAAGRETEALELFAVTRSRVAEELGADPGQELRAVHEAVLQGRIDGVPAPQPEPDLPVGRVPAQLPARVRVPPPTERPRRGGGDAG
jgi:DNA-binding SARP family transcriptional activator